MCKYMHVQYNQLICFISRYINVFITMLKDFDRGLKVIIAGSSGVGKSSILLRYVDNLWSSNTMSTIGVDFKFKTLVVNGVKVKMQIWDTAGSQAFKSIVSAYYRGADAVIMVYDASDKTSFLQLKNFWIQQVNRYKEPHCQLVLLANKSDMCQDAISKQQVNRFISQQKVLVYKETSAKTGDRVAEAFQQLAQYLVKKKPNKGKDSRQKQMLGMNIETTDQKSVSNRKKCCQ